MYKTSAAVERTTAKARIARVDNDETLEQKPANGWTCKAVIAEMAKPDIGSEEDNN